MSGPAIPYLELPEIPLSFLQHLPILGNSIDPASPPTIKPFGTLVALGVYIGSVLAVRRAKERGMDTKQLNDFIFYVVGCGFVGAHVLDAIFYYPDKVAQNPLFLLELWAGLSSFGGFTGALIGAFLWKWRNRGASILAQCDVVCSAFPLAWVFGRSGCSVAHDHPGRLTDSWLGVQYPNLPPGMGRFDLGLIEMVLTIPLAVAFHFLWRQKPRFFGFYAGWMSVVYAPVRFGLDFLRVAPGDKLPADERYLGLTPAQWAAFGLFGLGVYLLRHGKAVSGHVPATYEEAQALARASATADAEDDQVETADERARRKRRAAAIVDESLAPAGARAAVADEEATDAEADPRDALEPAAAEAGERPRRRRRPRSDKGGQGGGTA